MTIIEEESYQGTMVFLQHFGTLGLRERSKSGEPTLDVALECVPEITKIKFVL